eukprot:5041240-Amphidinium_carterae.1
MSVVSASFTSHEEALRQKLRQHQNRKKLQEFEAHANVYKAASYYQTLVDLNQNASHNDQISKFAQDFQERVIAETRSTLSRWLDCSMQVCPRRIGPTERHHVERIQCQFRQT